MTGPVSRAFAQALIAQLPALRRYAGALCGNTSLADDLVQDAVERALSRAASLQDINKIAAWMRSIVHHLYLDELRRGKTRGTGVDLADVENDIALSTMPVDRTAVAEIVRATQALTLEHRQILVLSGVEGLSYQEIADELGVKIGTVMSRLARARAALRAMLAEPLLAASPHAGARPT